MAECTEPNIPEVDNEACECQEGIHSSNCINLAEADGYLNLPAGTTLTKIVDRISKKIKSNSLVSDKNKAKQKTIELILTQTGANAPNITEVVKDTPATILSTYTSPGNYVITSSNTFIGDVSIYIGSFDRDYFEQVKAYKIDDSNISVRTGIDSNFDTDDIMASTPILIKIPI